jgi:hypothetical protein
MVTDARVGRASGDGFRRMSRVAACALIASILGVGCERSAGDRRPSVLLVDDAAPRDALDRPSCQDELTPAQMAHERGAREFTQQAIEQALATRGLERVQPRRRVVPLDRLARPERQPRRGEIRIDSVAPAGFVRDRDGITRRLVLTEQVTESTFVVRCGCDPPNIPGGMPPKKPAQRAYFYEVGPRHGEPVEVVYQTKIFKFERICREAHTGPMPP